MAGPEAGRAGRPALIFLHLPKAGGTTLHEILAREYPPEGTFRIGVGEKSSVADFIALPEAQRLSYRMMRGHMDFGLHRYCASPANYITILREPVARVISTYHYIRRTPRHTHHARVVSGGMTLAQFVRQGVSLVGIDNGQTRMISGQSLLEEPVGFRQCRPEMLERARANLAAHFCVGLLEQFDASLLMMQRAFAWKTPYYVARNVSGGHTAQPEVSAADRDLIAEHNQLDLALYESARQLFQRQMEQQGRLFGLRVRVFTWLNLRRASRASAPGAAATVAQ